MLGAIISGGLSLVGGLFGRSSAKSSQRRAAQAQAEADAYNEAKIRQANQYNRNLGKALGRQLRKEKLVETTSQTNKSWVDVDGMMKAAAKAGFNPQAFLNAGGLQAYTRSSSDVKSTSVGHNAAAAYGLMAQLMSPTIHQKQAAPVHHIPSVGEAVVNGLKAGFDRYSDDQVRQQAQDFQRELLGMQLNAIQNRATGNKGSLSFNVPGFSTSGSMISSKGSGGLSMHTPGETSYTNPYPVGSGLGINPSFKDAEAGETRYGDIAQELFGFTNLVADSLYNIAASAKASRDRKASNPNADPFYRLLGLTAPQRRALPGTWLNNVQQFFGGLGKDAANLFHP